jgi:hypothetical protein
MGTTCSECQDNYHFNTKTSECILWEECTKDTCSGHGECNVNILTGTAECTCDTGFVNNDDDGTQ